MKKLNKITIIALTILIALASVTLGKAFAYFGSKSSASGSITMGTLSIGDVKPSDGASIKWDIGNLQPNQSFGGSYKVDVNSNINYYIRILFKASVTPQSGKTHINGTSCGDYVTDDTDILSISIDGTTTGAYQKSTTKTNDGYTPYYRLTPTAVTASSTTTTTPETFNIDLKVADWVGSGYCDYYMGATVSINMYVQVMQADYLESNTIGDASTADDMHNLWIATGVEQINAPDVSEYSNLTFTVLDSDAKTMSVKKANTSITEANIPAMVKKDSEVYTVTQIADEGFVSCSNLTSVTIPNSVTVIGNAAFYGDTALISINIPNSVESIGTWAFQGCVALDSITITSGVTSIGTYAFAGCTALTSVAIPSSVTNIGWSAFSGCTNLTSVTFENTKGWRLNSTTGTSIDVTNASTNATNLKSDSGAWCGRDLYRV